MQSLNFGIAHYIEMFRSFPNAELLSIAIEMNMQQRGWCYIHRHDFDSYNNSISGNINITITITKWSGIQNTKYIIKTGKRGEKWLKFGCKLKYCTKHTKYKIRNLPFRFSLSAGFIWIGWCICIEIETKKEKKKN